MKKFIWTMLILIAIVLGSLLGIYRYQKNAGDIGKDVGFFSFLLTKRKPGITPQEMDNKKPDTVTGPQTPSGKEAGSEDTKPKFDREAFEKFRQSARNLYSKADYSAAELNFAKALELLNTAEPGAGPEAGDPKRVVEIDRMRLRSHLFAKVLENMYLNNLIDGANMVQIRMKLGKKPFFARLVEKTEKEIKIVRQSGITATLKESDIKSVVTLTPDQYRKSLETILNERIKEAKEAFDAENPDYYSFFQCAGFAYQNKLTGHLTQLLEKTFEHAESEELIDKLHPGNNDELKFALHRSFKRDSKADVYAVVVKKNKKTTETGEEKGSGTGEVKPKPPAPTGDPLQSEEWENADQLYMTGYEYYAKAVPGTPKHDENLEKAAPFLFDAAEILEKLRKLHPQNTELDNKLVEIRKILFDIMVRLPLKREN